jgi:hypothetical protein
MDGSTIGGVSSIMFIVYTCSKLIPASFIAVYFINNKQNKLLQSLYFDLCSEFVSLNTNIVARQPHRLETSVRNSIN